MAWLEKARGIIASVHATLPDNMAIADRKKAIAAAYPFGARANHPYKQWCKAQREYLARYSTPDNDKKHAAWRDEMRALGFVFEDTAS